MKRSASAASLATCFALLLQAWLLSPDIVTAQRGDSREATTKARLTPDNFSYQGCFALGPGINGRDYSLSEGFTLRRVDGELRVLYAGWRMVEMTVPPSLGEAPECPAARLVRVWGEVPNPLPYQNTPFNGPIKNYGLYWDEPTQKLWYGYGHEYNTLWPLLPSIGAATLDPERGVVSHGIWGLKDRSTKMLYGGVTPVPQWFADQFTRGRRLAAGFGGYFSIATTGPISMGPALTAFDPAAMLAAKDKSSLPHTPLVGYPFVDAPYRTDRAHRDTDVINDYDRWKPRNGIGYWTWNDYLHQACYWVDTESRSGLLCAPSLGNGRGWYYGSTLNAERGSHAWMIYDTADLAQVARGRKSEWDIQPSFHPVQYPGMTYPLKGGEGAPLERVIGMAMDGKRLYVATLVAWKSAALVHVYDVAD